MIEFKSGDVFASKAQVLVNTVNCCGVMGAGIAKEYRKRFPKMYRAYRKACRSGEIAIGHPQLWKSDDQWILNFPTKLHFIQNSDLAHIRAGLEWLILNYRDLGIKTIALPPLGAGLGKLDWKAVRQLIIEKLVDLEDLYVEVWESPEASQIPRV